MQVAARNRKAGAKKATAWRGGSFAIPQPIFALSPRWGYAYRSISMGMYTQRVMLWYRCQGYSPCSL